MRANTRASRVVELRLIGGVRHAVVPRLVGPPRLFDPLRGLGVSVLVHGSPTMPHFAPFVNNQ
ncbi:MAG: hypothetical protein KJO36_07535, partial [Acidimicrobiia bacterium]|nr:hypothetical protein [Acidimicrobiia bacterium]